MPIAVQQGAADGHVKLSRILQSQNARHFAVPLSLVVRQLLNVIARLLVVAVVLNSACTAGNIGMPKCDPKPQPISRAIPELPPRLHNAFEGHSVVQFVIGSDGQVYEPRIESSDWLPVGRAGGEPEGYEDAIVAAISEWRYAPRKDSCRATVRMEIAYDEG